MKYPISGAFSQNTGTRWRATDILRFSLRRKMRAVYLGLCLLSPGIPALAEAADAPKEGGNSDQAKPEKRFDWSKVPPVTPMPRLGSYLVPPKGPGYYSAWDLVTGKRSEAPPVWPYAPFALFPPSNFDVDFRYLDKPDNQIHDFFDPVKRIHLGDDWLVSFGGSLANRFMDESDSRLTNRDNAYNLFRLRLNGDVWFRDWARVYAEFIYADDHGEDLAPLPIDANRADLLNLFTDIKLGSVLDAPAYIRVGRQELLYGSQRLISTLDWANTRRTFQGAKAFWHSPQFDLDAFWTRPVNINASHFDKWDEDRDFAGLWGTYKPLKGHFADVYFLSLTNDKNTAKGRGGQLGDSAVYTLGSRYIGDYNNILFELEGMYQFGDWSNQDISAGAVAAGVGYNFAEVPMTPQLWVRYDYASGTSNPGQGGTFSTFNPLFPFGHYYMGYIDQVGRQNINDFNLQLAMYPQPWLTAIIQYHKFWLAENRDALFNAAGRATRRDPTGQAGDDVGDEIDFRFNIHVSRHQDILLGYSKLFAGGFIKNSFPVLANGALAPRPGPNVSPDLFYAQYTFRF